MAGTIAHVLHVDIFDALSLPERKLSILYNEARRQRTLNLVTTAKAWNPKAHEEEIDEIIHIHGHYTEGFYDDQLDRLFRDFGK